MLDTIIINFDKALKNITLSPVSSREHPDAKIDQINLTKQDIKKSIKLMRINHCGEICAQALYHGQSIFAKNTEIQIALDKAAKEEIDHLAWTKQRLYELNGKTTIFGTLFYGSSFLIGMWFGYLGDRISLGFLDETEHQVANHLNKHIQKLPTNDIKSKLILEQMLLDELEHKSLAYKLGGVELLPWSKTIMRYCSKVMTSLTAII